MIRGNILRGGPTVKPSPPKGVKIMNTRKNALHNDIKTTQYSKIREAMESLLRVGEEFSVIQDEVEDIMSNLADFNGTI